MSILDWVFPRFCHGCSAPARHPLCDACSCRLSWIGEAACRRCGAADPGRGPDCPDCRGKPTEFETAVALGTYEGLLRDLVLRMKEPAGAELATHFGAELARHPRLPPFDLVSSVPLTRWDFVFRGYDHAGELALALARRAGKPFRERLLKKIRRTCKQKELPLSRRILNPMGAFQAESVPNLSVLVVDDVLTTGATLSSCARALKAAGARRVFAAVVARG